MARNEGHNGIPKKIIMPERLCYFASALKQPIDLTIMKSSIRWPKSVLFIALIISINEVFSQGKFEISAGLGVPEYNTIKIRYGQKIQVGVSVHFYYDKGGGIFGEYYSWSSALEILYHFGGKSIYFEQPTWYLLGGLGYYHNDLLIDFPHEEYDIGFYPRIGRGFNFSKKIGINLDAGLFLPLSVRENYEPYKFRILPSGCVSFFVRF